MVWKRLIEGMSAALNATGLYTPERLARLELSIPRDSSHGDWTTNLALVLAKEVGRPPRAVAEGWHSARTRFRLIATAAPVASVVGRFSVPLHFPVFAAPVACARRGGGDQSEACPCGVPDGQ